MKIKIEKFNNIRLKTDYLPKEHQKITTDTSKINVSDDFAIQFYPDNHYQDNNKILICFDIDMKRETNNNRAVIKIISTNFMLNSFKSKSGKGIHTFFFIDKKDLYLIEKYNHTNKEDYQAKNGEKTNGIDIFCGVGKYKGFINTHNYFDKLIKRDIPILTKDNFSLILECFELLNIKITEINLSTNNHELDIKKIEQLENILKNNINVDYETRCLLMRYCGANKLIKEAKNYIQTIYKDRNFEDEWNQYKKLTEYNEYNQKLKEIINKLKIDNYETIILVNKEQIVNSYLYIWNTNKDKFFIKVNQFNNFEIFAINGNEINRIHKERLQNIIQEKWNNKYKTKQRGYITIRDEIIKAEIPSLKQIDNNYYNIEQNGYNAIGFKNCVYNLYSKKFIKTNNTPCFIYFDYDIDLNNLKTEFDGMFKKVYEALILWINKIDHFNKITLEKREEFIQVFFANAIDFYRQTNRCAYFLHGKKAGIGKSRLIEFIGQALGKYFLSEIELDNNFSSSTIEGKLVCLVDDKGLKLNNKITTLITKKKGLVNPKGIQQYEAINVSSFYFCDNDLKLNGITENHGIKRRICIWECDDKFSLFNVENTKKDKLIECYYYGYWNDPLIDQKNILLNIILCHQKLKNNNYQEIIKDHPLNKINDCIFDHNTIAQWLIEEDWEDIGNQYPDEIYYNSYKDILEVKKTSFLYKLFNDYLGNRPPMTAKFLWERIKELMGENNIVWSTSRSLKKINDSPDAYPKKVNKIFKFMEKIEELENMGNKKKEEDGKDIEWLS